MSDEHELDQSPLSPADDERIRRLLAQARHTDPMPDQVATRLDAVLRGLSSERSSRAGAEDTGAPVVDLAARRRRTAVNLLVAAAAVLVVGFGITQVLPNGLGGGSDSGADTLSAGEAPAADSNDSNDSAGGRNVSPETASERPSPTEAEGDFAAKPFRIRSDSFGPDVRQLRRQVMVLEDTNSLLAYPAADCLSADAGDGDVVSATYDGAPAAVVLRAPSGDVQVVDLYLCGDAAPRRSITLTAP